MKLKYFSIFKSFLDYKIYNKPFLAGFKLTYKCNLKCHHCPFWKNKGDDLSFKNVKDVLDNMYYEGARVIIFEGGEPTLWKDNNFTFNDVLDYAKKKFISVNFTTNGLNGFEYNADAIWISFDGLEKNHNKIRGEGVFEKVIKNLEDYRRKKIFSVNKRKVFANICINSYNVHEIPKLIIFLKKFIDGITIQFYYPYENDFSLFVNKKERVWILNKLKDLKKKGYPILDSLSCLDDLKYNTWKCHPELLINAEPDGTIIKGCYVKNRGEINCKYCGFAAHVELSKAFDLKFGSILTGIKAFC